MIEPLIQEKQCQFHSGCVTQNQLYTHTRVVVGSWEYAQPAHSLWSWRRHSTVSFEILYSSGHQTCSWSIGLEALC